ncbi:MAG: energy-coupling factor ABC transporter permease [Promethearchaeota archaeon]
MHIPDGFISLPILIVTWFITIGFVAYSLYQLREINEKQLSYMAVLGAVVFGAQMLNFPIASGTSGHLGGAVLIAAIVGPWASIITMTVILTIQCLVFADGGILALGANIMNMGVIGALVGYSIFDSIRKLIKNDIGYWIGSFLGASIAVMVAAIFTAIEIGLSGISDLKTAVIVMTIWHTIIGVGEGIITASVLGYLKTIEFDIQTFSNWKAVSV